MRERHVGHHGPAHLSISSEQNEGREEEAGLDESFGGVLERACLFPSAFEIVLWLQSRGLPDMTLPALSRASTTSRDAREELDDPHCARGMV